MFKVMTVCTGNICRSPVGEFLLRQAAQERNLAMLVSSTGISNEEEGKPIDRRAAKVLSEYGIDASSHRARQFAVADFQEQDLILALDTNHFRALKRLAPNTKAAAKVRLLREFDPQVKDLAHEELGIYDPWYGDQSDFYTTFEMIKNAVPGLIAYAKKHEV